MTLKFLIGTMLALAVSPLNAYEPPPRCDAKTAIAEAKKMLADAPVRHATGKNSVTKFVETYRRQDGSPYQRTYTDYVTREIPVVLLNATTCELKALTLTRTIRNHRGILTSSDANFSFDIEARSFGTVWNWHNTPYVVTPSNWLVLLNKWQPYGKSESFFYVPFSTTLAKTFPELAQTGREHYRTDLLDAFESLNAAKIASRAIPEKLAGDVVRDFFGHDLLLIPLVEHADPFESYAYTIGAIEMSPFRRVQTIVGANDNYAFYTTTSRASAQGLMQIWPPTCNGNPKKKILGLRQLYPQAKLPKNCIGTPEGIPHGHIESIKAAILLYDYHLAIFIKELHLTYDAQRGVFLDAKKNAIVQNDLSRWLAASYNAGPRGIIREIAAHGKEWDKPHRKGTIKRETFAYLDKFDFLKGNILEEYFSASVSDPEKPPAP